MQPEPTAQTVAIAAANVRPFARVPQSSWPVTLERGATLEMRCLGPELSGQFVTFLEEGPTVGAGLTLSSARGSAAWADQIRSARRITLCASSGSSVLGSVSVVRRYLTWMRHLAEVDLLVAASASEPLGCVDPTDRSLQHLAGTLLREVLRLVPDLGVAKLIARVPRSIALHPQWLLDAGFSGVASLADWIEIEPGRTSDLDLFTLEAAGLSSVESSLPVSPFGD